MDEGIAIIMVTETNDFANLTWDDLDEWAGSKIVSRGRSYKGNVKDLRRTAEGRLLAWVHGTKKYATLVWMDGGGLNTVCTCPYGERCKHSVAVILVYLDTLKEKRELPFAQEDDPRFHLLDRFSDEEENDDAWEDEDMVEEESDDGEDLNEPPISSKTRKKRGTTSSPTRKKTGRRKQMFKDALQSMSKEKLVEFIVSLTERYPEIGAEIVEKEELKSGKVRDIVRGVRAEIEELTSEPAWRDHWNGEGNTPDYSHVCRQLEMLLSMGYADEVVSIGKDLWRLGNEQIGQSDDEGETAGEIADCMDIVLRALPKSALSPVQQILWVVDAYLDDNYSALNKEWHQILEHEHGKEDWSAVADHLSRRLNAASQHADPKSFHDKYERENLMRWVIRALERSGRKTEILPLLEREAPITACYEQLVDNLIASKRRDEARQWALTGYRKTVEPWPGIASALADKLREMAESEKDYPAVAGYRAMEFFESPSLLRYQELQSAAEAINVWPDVREAALTFLETGARPDLRPETASSKKGAAASPDWPLPVPEVAKAPRKSLMRGNNTGTLIAIALHEKRHDDAIRLLDTMRKSCRYGDEHGLSVAEAVQTTHPDVALRIWKEHAASQIAYVKPQAYVTAAHYLGKMRQVYQDTNRTQEWGAYLSTLRTQHKAKRSLMRILDDLEGKGSKTKRILDTA